MQTRSLNSRVILLCALVAVSTTLISASVLNWQDNTPKLTVPPAEAKAVKAIEAATDVTAKFVAADEFVKKYTASKVRLQVAQYLANQIFALTDPSQKLATGQKYIAVFTEPMEAKLVQPALI